MNPAEPIWLVGPLVCFCRVGACLMVVPGFSSGRFPVRFRLSFALALSLALTGLVERQVRATLAAEGYAALPGIVVSETLTGLSFGLLVRILFASAQMAGVFSATYLGLTSPAGPPVDDSEATPPPADLMQITALAVFFFSDLHHELIAALARTYDILPLAGRYSNELWLHEAIDVATSASAIALRLTAPLLVMSLLINLALGLAGRLLPMLPVQFLGVPLVLIAGLWVIAVTAQELVGGIAAEISRWLTKG